MKKRFLAAGLAIALSFAAVPMTVSANAEIRQEECDAIFAATINSLIDESDVENGKITALRKPLYDISVEPLGYVYEFSLKYSDGYAIIVNTEGKYITQEVIPDGVSPYSECEGQCIYVGNLTYLEYTDGVYTDAESGTVIPEEVVECLAEDALYGDGGSGYTTQAVTIYYASKTKNDYRMALMTPDYTSSPFVSGCACIAGANVVGYFDRFCPNLIPNYEPGYEYLGYYFYYTESAATTGVLTQLYDDMGTTAETGTTTKQFLDGMKKFCNRAGYNFNYSSCMSGSKFNYSTAMNSMLNNKPIALFLTGYNVTDIGEKDGRDSFGYAIYSANHVMVGFGYYEANYTYDSGQKETLQFLYVASCVGNTPNGYFNINYNTKINDAYAVSIY